MKRARRRNIPDRATAVLAALHEEHLAQPPALAAAYAATVRALTAVIITLNEQVRALEEQVKEHFGRPTDAEVYLSQPGLGPILGARVLAEFGDDPCRYAGGKARRNYAGTSPVTRASGKKKVVAARFVRNDRLTDALHAQAQSALTASPVPGPPTTSSAPRDTSTTTPSEGSRIASSASFTAASEQAPPTTRQPPGATGRTFPNLPPQLDI